MCCAKSSALNAEPKRRFGDEVPEEAAVHAETTEAVRQSGGMTPWVMGMHGAPWCVLVHEENEDM